MQLELRLKVFGRFANWINTKVHREGDTFENEKRRGDEKMQDVGGDHLNQPTHRHHEGPGKNRSVYLLLGHQIFFISSDDWCMVIVFDTKTPEAAYNELISERLVCHIFKKTFKKPFDKNIS